MNTTQLIYLVFGVVLLAALSFDLGLFSKKNKPISIRTALIQTIFWVSLSLLFWIFIWFEKGHFIATKYISAYLMEWSLSLDNIFVFILIFSYFKINELDTGRALLVGILLAIAFRIIFISIGLELINRLHWILYVFGAILVFTGAKLFLEKKEEIESYNPSHNLMYRLIKKFFPISTQEPHGRYFVKENGKRHITSLTLVVITLAATDILFAMDSIPTVVSLVRDRPNVPFSEDDKLVIYSSNIFAVLGLRSLFFLLQGAVHKFRFLQQGIAVVLVFIGFKMLVEIFHLHLSIYVSLTVIVGCIGISILYSLLKPLPVKEETTMKEEVNSNLSRNA
jgi:tellurite resistance protein TerC